jgi:ubiquinone/menaquinone biosynthesis C-methylase UbiE
VPTDPLAGSAWSSAQTVEGFARGRPNEVLLRYAAEERERRPHGVLLDIGCGAGRNAVPLAESGWRVLGTDLSWPMLVAAHSRSTALQPGRLDVALAPMEPLPVRSRSVDLIVAHGIWNLARSSQQFRRAVHEAARVAKPVVRLHIFAEHLR